MSADTARTAGPAAATGPHRDRTLITGWFSFRHGEATAGDVLAAEAIAGALAAAAIPHAVAWSPGFHPRQPHLHLEDADPADYPVVVFGCGPLHSTPPGPGVPSPLLELHARFARSRRIAVGVSVPDPTDPAVTGFDVVLPRDAAGAPTAPDLALAAPEPPAVDVVGVILTGGQHEYGARRRHGAVADRLTGWLHGLDVARVELDTRLDSADWRLPATPGQLRSVLRRLDAVVTNRLHGLVLGLQAGVPVLAVDPVDGGAKVSAQARALDWPAVLPPDRLDEATLTGWWDWCRSAAGRRHAARYRAATGPTDLTAALVAAVRTG